MGNQNGEVVGAHLVGGLKEADAESAMRAAMKSLARHLHAVPDGETGDRSQWVYWQMEKLSTIDGIDFDPEKSRARSGQQQSLAVEPSVTELPARSLGYADAAERSYATFTSLREEGVIPPDVKFQVSIPTPYATVIPWIVESDHDRFLPIYGQAIGSEIADIVGIVGDDLLIQFDVAVEVGVLTGAFSTSAALTEKSGVLQTLRDAFALVPAGTATALHLCYGDYQHQHFTVPEDLALSVELAQAVADQTDIVHMPVDRETGRAASYFEPLRDLSVSQLALGIVDYEGDVGRTRGLIAAASEGSGGMQFAAATECGMARIDERGGDGPSLEGLLDLHAEVASPIR